ncbi:cell division protein FtsW, lipid II flippase [Bacillus sp. OV322]|uniref:FtsW/RodA/SpoVE family cell cycle protein n=1 Tax=Bacillus sp. OV322 TaxID=1882764 RepID=UPI0008EE666E|nr:FtsW/RodA/SpoVE family cell cycle protein [Bacillus sp. OV322]SFC91677.1 cell division protein FtsW, lipid II flippase [Bacillus sp. OV322]
MADKKTFISEVTAQIRSKEAKQYVSEELGYHLEEAKKSFLQKGMAETEAEEKAIKRMGSPQEIGQQLNRVHRPRPDWYLLGLLCTVLCLGFLPLLMPGFLVPRFILSKVIIVVISAAAAFVLMKIDYRKWKRAGWLFYTVGVLFLIGIDFFSNLTINGKAYLKFGSITLDSIMVMPFFYLAYASFMNNRKCKVWHFVLLFLVPLILFGYVPNLSAAFIYSMMVFIMLWKSVFSRKTIIAIWSAAAMMLAFITAIFWHSARYYQKERILAILHPYHDTGYTSMQAKKLLTHAGWFGQSNPYDLFIAEPYTNFVFVSFTYCYGWLLAAFLVLILIMFPVRMAMTVSKVKDGYGKLLTVGAAAFFTVQFACHIGMAAGVFPMTEMSLPFISYGLAPALLNAAVIGIVLSVYRKKNLVAAGISAEKR